jgi:Asp-tRNA(Asn)/Glu-tRNA(Gln) amidotransferase A subunit family amidase
VQLVAASGREDLLLRVAAQLEQAVPWHHRDYFGTTNCRTEKYVG